MGVLDLVELLVEAVEGVDLLDLEPRHIRLVRPVFLRHVERLEQGLESLLVKLFFHLNLREIEEVLICFLEGKAVLEPGNGVDRVFLIGSASQQICHDVC